MCCLFHYFIYMWLITGFEDFKQNDFVLVFHPGIWYNDLRTERTLIAWLVLWSLMKGMEVTIVDVG